MHIIALIVGMAVIGAATHVNIGAIGGYFAQAAPLQIAVALGLIVGSIALGLAWSAGRWAIMLVLFVALASGEVVAMLGTAERVIAARDAAAAPIRAAQAARESAQARLERAQAARDGAEAASLTEAAKPGCKSNCRALLTAARADAVREVETARDALATLPVAQSATPLADRLQIEPWVLDLIAAALASIAANGLGASLIAFGAHRGKVREVCEGRDVRQNREDGEASQEISQKSGQSEAAPPRLPNVEVEKPVARPMRLIEAPIVTMSGPVELGPVELGPVGSKRAEAATVVARSPKALPDEAAPAKPRLAQPFPIDPLQHVAGYLRETIVPDPTGAVALSRLHQGYRPWCAASGKSPLPAAELGRCLRATFDRIGLEYREAAGDLEVVGARLRRAA